MKELKRNLQESIVLQNLFISIYPKMIKEKDKPFYKFVRSHTRTNYTDVANEIIKEVSVNLIKEIMVLLNQVWVDNPRIFDEGLKNDKNLFNEIKSQIADGEKLPFNNRELYKRVRQAIAHNSEDVENFVYNLKSFELNLGKVNGEDCVVNLKFSHFSQLLQVLFENVNAENNPIQFCIDGSNPIKTRQDIFENIKMFNGEEFFDLDENQINRIYNYFNYVRPGIEIEGNESEVKKVLSLPKNADRLIYEKIYALKAVKQMTSGSCWNEMELDDVVDNINTYQAIVSNLLFTMVSSRTNEELEVLLDGCVSGLGGNKIRHLRNALCHGRYFNDYNTCFYFYDGKEPSFKLKLNTNDINKILDRLANGDYSVSVLP